MKYSFILSLLVIVLLSSCTKEESLSKEAITAIDPIPQFAMTAARFQRSSRFLKREISFTRDNPLLKNVRLFSYDGAMRCMEIKLGTIDSAISNPVFTLKQTLTFNYDGASSLLPASLASVRTVFPHLTTTYYYKYNSQGRKIRDSVSVKNQAGVDSDKTIHYVYENDQVFVTPVFNNFPLVNNSFDTISLLKGGNIEKVASRSIRATGDQMNIYTFTYDQAISPYNKLNIANSLYFESPSIGLGYNVPKETHYMGVTTNNMTTWTSGNYTVRFTYWYNQEKYPVRKEMLLPGETTPIQVTVFEY